MKKILSTRAYWGTAAASLCLLLAACGGGGDGAQTPSGPGVTGVSQAHVPVGTTFEVTGRQLNEVTSFDLGPSPLPVVSGAPTRYVLRAPDVPASGPLTLQVGTGTASRRIATSFTLETYRPMQVVRVAQTGGAAGSLVEIECQDLDPQVQLLVGGQPAKIEAIDDHSLRARVPGGAVSGSLTLTSRWEKVIAAAYFEVEPTIQSTSLDFTASASGTRLVVKGVALDRASSVLVGGTAAQLESASPTQIIAVAPGSAEGDVILASRYQQVKAGSYLLRSDGRIGIERVSIGQRMMLDAGLASTRLTSGRGALAKVDLTTRADHLLAPQVRIVASVQGRDVGDLQLVGPSVVPGSSETLKLDRSFTGHLPEAMLQPGADLRLEVHDSVSAALVTSEPLKVTVDASPALDLVLVPVVAAGRAPQLPTMADVRQTLLRTMPVLDDKNLRVEWRAPYTTQALSSQPTYQEVSNLLYEMSTLRGAESPNTFYVGVVAEDLLRSAGISGVAYQGYANMRKPWTMMAGLVADAAANTSSTVDQFDRWLPWWGQTLAHELGHMFGLPHAPCGGAARPDSAYPYAGGTLGPQPLLDDAMSTLAEPAERGDASKRLTDVMGYCQGMHFSDYNYAILQQSMLSNFGSVLAAASSSAARRQAALLDSAPALKVTGQILANGQVELDPLSLAADSSLGAVAPGSEWTLSVRFEDGTEHVTSIELVGTGHTPPGEISRSRFEATVPNVGRVREVSVLRQGRAYASVRYAAMNPTTLSAVDKSPTLERSADRLVLRWDAARFPFAKLMHVSSSGQLRIWVLNATGGEWRHQGSGVPTDGLWIVDLSGSGEARRHRLAVSAIL